MPVSFDLTWDATNKRWRIMHKGQRYVVSCRQLGAPPTKEASYRAANDWWRQKLADIEGQVPTMRGQLIKELETWKARDQAQGLDTSAIEFEIDQCKNPGGDLNPKLVTFLFGEEYSALKPNTADLTVAFHVSRYLDLERARVKGGHVSLIEFDLARRCLDYFRDWIGPTTNVHKIDPDVWESYWTHLMALECSIEYRKKRFRFAKNFVTWLSSKAIIPMPANLMSRKYKFGSTVKKVATFTVNEVKTWLIRPRDSSLFISY